MKILFDLLTDNYPITGNPETDQVLYIIIGLIAFSVAFGLVGIIFDFFGYYDSQLMSDVHWGIRLVIFIGLSWIFKKAFEVLSWLFSFSTWVYIILILILIGVLIMIHYLRYQSRRNNSLIMIEEKEEVNEKVIEEHKEAINNEIMHNFKDYCPRCGGKLIYRNGPYGGFWGCSNYHGKEYNSCTYTRKYM